MGRAKTAVNEADVAVVKKADEAYGRGDTEAVVDSVAPGAHWEFVGRPEEHAPFGARKARASSSRC